MKNIDKIFNYQFKEFFERNKDVEMRILPLVLIILLILLLFVQNIYHMHQLEKRFQQHEQDLTIHVQSIIDTKFDGVFITNYEKNIPIIKVKM